jgi:hypothetical protein
MKRSKNTTPKKRSGQRNAFDKTTWTKDLVECIEMELLTWWHRMSVDKIRALAIQCHPWHEIAFTISFLTNRESSHNEAKHGKWDLPAWRLYNFTSGPDTDWPYAQKLMRVAHRYYMASERSGEPVKVRDELVRCCARALKSSKVTKALKRYNLAHDFELFAGHPDAPERNYCKPSRSAKQ